MSITLTRDELADLTGKRRPHAIRRALDSMGIPYRVRPDGTIAVMRSHAERDPDERRATIRAREPELRP